MKRAWRWLVAVLAVLLGFLAFDFWRHETVEWSKSVNLEGQTVLVAITHSYYRGVFPMGHDDLIPGGKDRFRTDLDFPDGRRISFTVTKEPRAIWSIEGQLYVACCTGDWLVAKVDESGMLTPITPRELPEAPRHWNLSGETQEFQKEWDDKFAMWLH